MRRIEKTIAETGALEPIVEMQPAQPVSDAVQRMLETRASCVLVAGGGRIQGIFTERDFLLRVAAARRSSADTRLEEVMTPDPQCLSPDHSVAYAINLMVTEGFRNVPVVDASGRAVGALTARGVIQRLVDIFGELDSDVSDAALNDWVDEGGG